MVKYCQDQFGFKLPSELITHRTEKFLAKLEVSVSLKVLIIVEMLCYKLIVVKFSEVSLFVFLSLYATTFVWCTKISICEALT